MGFALGVAVTAVTVTIVVVVLLLTTGGSSTPHRKRLPPLAKLPRLTQAYQSKPIGVVGLIPQGWTARRGLGFVTLRSHDGDAVIVIQAENNTLGTHALMVSALRVLTSRRAGLRPRLAAGKALGGLPANSRVIYTTDARRQSIRILVVGARGRHIGYVLEAVTLRSAPLRDLEESQEVVNTLHLTG